MSLHFDFKMDLFGSRCVGRIGRDNRVGFGGIFDRFDRTAPNAFKFVQREQMFGNFSTQKPTLTQIALFFMIRLKMLRQIGAILGATLGAVS